MSSQNNCADSVHARFDAIELRVKKLEEADPIAKINHVIDQSAPPFHASPSAASREASLPAGVSHGQLRLGCSDAEPSETQQRLTAELLQKGVPHSFCRVGPGYYDLSLEERRSTLGATTIHQLCKSMVMENTKAPASAQRFFVVIIQYSSSIQAELLKRHVLSIETSEGTRLSRSQCNMRLASEENSARLTGFVHNAVSPVGLSEALPIIVAYEIADLQFVWLGGGEPDLKLGMSVPHFIAAFKAVVANVSNQNCTVDKV